MEDELQALADSIQAAHDDVHALILNVHYSSQGTLADRKALYVVRAALSAAQIALATRD